MGRVDITVVVVVVVALGRRVLVDEQAKGAGEGAVLRSPSIVAGSLAKSRVEGWMGSLATGRGEKGFT